MNIVKNSTTIQTQSRKTNIGRVPKNSKITLNEFPSCISDIAIAMQNPAPNKNLFHKE